MLVSYDVQHAVTTQHPTCFFRVNLAVRASKNGRSVNSEIVMILQAAIDEDRSPKSVESFAQQEADKFKEALLETLKTMYGKDEK